MYDRIFSDVAGKYGLDPSLLSTFARIESGGNPGNRTGSYKGLFQLSDAEFARGGGTGNIFDPVANTEAAARVLKSKSDAFAKQYGRAPSPQELYMIHQQGEGGASAHWRNPNAPAWQNMYSTAEGRQKGPEWAKRAIWGNVPDDVKARYGSVDNLTSAEFTKLWEDKYNRLAGKASDPNAQVAAAIVGPQDTTRFQGQTVQAGQSTMALDDYVSDKDIDLQKQMAMAMLNDGRSTAPVGHWTQALARALQGAVGGYNLDMARQNERGNQASNRAFMRDVLTGGQQQASPPPPQQPQIAPPGVAAQPPAYDGGMQPPAPATPSQGPAIGTGAMPSMPAPLAMPSATPEAPLLPSQAKRTQPSPELATPRGQNRMTEQQYADMRMRVMTNPAYMRLPEAQRAMLDKALDLRKPIPPKIEKYGEDAVDMTDPSNPKVIYRSQKTPDAQNNYEFYVAQELKNGRPPKSFQDYELELKRASVAQPENAFDVAAAKSMAERHSKMIDAGDVARGFRGQVEILREHSRNIGNQGAWASIAQAIGPYATALDIPIDKLNDMQAFQSIIEKVAPTMRAPGSGATSDIEYKGFLKSLPQLTGTAEGREMILNQLAAIATDAEQRAAISAQVLNGEIPRKQADQALKSLPDVMTIYKQYRDNNGKRPQQPQAGPGAAPQPIRVRTPEEASRLPSGTPIMLPDGTLGKVP